MVSGTGVTRHGSSVPHAGVATLFSSSLAGADWLHGRLRRRMLNTFPFSSLRAHDYRKRLSAFTSPAANLCQERDVVSAFTEAGALMLRKRDASLLFGTELMPLCQEAHAMLAERQDTLFENEAALSLCPAFYRLGLAPAILDLAEACLGLECLYLGATLKREKADGQVVGTRQWHLDIEDEKLFRILLYLCPVASDTGPFEFFPRQTSQMIKLKLHYRSGYVAEARMSEIAAPQLLCQCIGNQGDAVIFDGAGVFHRGRAPLGQDRYSITFAYCSRRPLELRPSARLPAPLHAAFLATLSPRQRRTIPPPRMF